MSDISTGYTFVDGEKGITAQKLNDEVNLAVINPAFVSAKPSTSVVDNADQLLILKAAGTYARAPFSTVSTSVAGQLALADNTTNGMLRQVSGVATDVVDGTNHCRPIASVITQATRGYNAIGNPNFEVDQRNVGNTVAGVTGAVIVDRWTVNKTAATAVISAGQNSVSGDVLIPGTNFRISRAFFRITLTTAQASLAASEYIYVVQIVEGPNMRELYMDVHSVSLLVRSSVAGLQFGMALRDSTGTRSLTKLCAIPSANTWTLITLPNLPVWASGGAWNNNPGAEGYRLFITLGAGSTYTAPANDTWQTGNYLGALGQSNFAAQAVNSTFDIAFVQHEPGNICTSLIDKPFAQNYDESLRYYQKSYEYPTAVGAIVTAGIKSFGAWGAVAGGTGTVVFHKPMAKTPTVTLYNHGTGAANSVRDNSAVDHASAIGQYPATTGFGEITFTTATTAAMPVFAHYTADTGW